MYIYMYTYVYVHTYMCTYIYTCYIYFKLLRKRELIRKKDGYTIFIILSGLGEFSQWTDVCGQEWVGRVGQISWFSSFSAGWELMGTAVEYDTLYSFSSMYRVIANFFMRGF